MMSNDFEKAFGDFVDRRACDRAENTPFASRYVTISFQTGIFSNN